MEFSNIKTLVTHAHCPDGIASALIVLDALPQKIDVKFCQYNTKEHIQLKATPGMLFADFTPPRERLQEFLDAEAIVLDHHKTQRDIIEAFGPNGLFGDETLDPGVSGTVLAWRHIWLKTPKRDIHGSYANWVSNFARLIGIRDTWQKTNPDWDLACATSSALIFPPTDDLLALGLENLCIGWDTRYGWAGEINYAKHKERCKYVANQAFRWVSPKGTRLALFQGTGISSDATEHLPDADLVVGFDVSYDDNKVKYTYSLRSRTNFDCSKFARQFGGGGHTKAAGFSWEHPACDPYMLFMKLLP